MSRHIAPVAWREYSFRSVTREAVDRALGKSSKTPLAWITPLFRDSVFSCEADVRRNAIQYAFVTGHVALLQRLCVSCTPDSFEDDAYPSELVVPDHWHGKVDVHASFPNLLSIPWMQAVITGSVEMVRWLLDTWWSTTTLTTDTHHDACRVRSNLDAATDLVLTRRPEIADVFLQWSIARPAWGCRFLAIVFTHGNVDVLVATFRTWPLAVVEEALNSAPVPELLTSIMFDPQHVGLLTSRPRFWKVYFRLDHRSLSRPMYHLLGRGDPFPRHRSIVDSLDISHDPAEFVELRKIVVSEQRRRLRAQMLGWRRASRLQRT